MTVDVRGEEHLDPGSEPASGSASGSAAEPPADPAPAPTTRRRRLRLIALVLLLVAAVFLAGSALVWWRADHDDSLALAQTRDVVLVDARRDIEVLNSLDYRSVPAGLTRWRAVSTGTLGKQLGAIDDPTRQALVDAGKVSTGKVVEAALTALHPSQGTATAIATVEISVRDSSGATQVKRDRFTVGLSRVAGRWLVSSLDQLPVETP